MTRLSAFILLFGFCGLCACATEPRPDYTIRVEPATDGQGFVALPPPCPAWTDNPATTLDNQPLPQFGCADARNLALMVDRPEDLLQGRPLGPASGVTAAGTIIRYENNQTRGLIYISPSSDNSIDVTSAPSANSGLTGESPPSPSSGSASGK